MASPIGSIAKGVAPLVAQKAVELAKDEQARKAVLAVAAPVAGGAVSAAKVVAGRVRLPQKADPLTELEAALPEVEKLITSRQDAAVDTALLTQWRRELAGIRDGLALARVDEGKGRMKKLGDLRRRKQALVDAMYASTKGSPGMEAME